MFDRKSIYLIRIGVGILFYITYDMDEIFISCVQTGSIWLVRVVALMIIDYTVIVYAQVKDSIEIHFAADYDEVSTSSTVSIHAMCSYFDNSVDIISCS